MIYAYIYQQNNPTIADDQIRMSLYSIPQIIKDKGVEIKLKGGEYEKSYEKTKSFFEDKFRVYLSEIFNKDVHFVSSNNEDSCNYCNFLTFCNRKKKVIW